MQSHGKRWAWRLVKTGLALVVLYFIAKQFWQDLSRLDDIQPLRLRSLDDIQHLPWRRLGWGMACGGLYLAGLFPSAWFWRHVLCVFGYPISLYAAARGHYISQIGKYVPGKMLAIWIRAALVRPSGAPYGVSIIASFYEVFTGMAAGALVAALIYVVEPPIIGGDEALRLAGFEWHPLWTGVVLIGVCGVPLLPGVFNFIIGRLAANIQAIELYRLPPVRFGTLAGGLLATGAGWWLHGLSWWAMLQAVLPDPPSLTLSTWAQCTASIAFANVVGFAAIIFPGGVGIREYALKMLLSSAGPVQYITLSAILLRLDWIVTEALVTLATYWWKPAAQEEENLATDETRMKHG
jgi:glycosyltransferase 2 family protein